MDFDIFSNCDWSKNYIFKKWISHASRASNESESNFLSISIDSSLDSNEQKLAKSTFIFSRILIGRKILEWKKSVFHRFRVYKKEQWNFLSISMDSCLDSNEKIVGKWTFIFSRILIGRKFMSLKNGFLTDHEHQTKVNRIFSASVSTPFSIPMSRSSRNGLSYFLEFWLVEKFLKEEIDLSRVWNIQQRSIEFSQHQYRLLHRFQWR